MAFLVWPSAQGSFLAKVARPVLRAAPRGRARWSRHLLLCSTLRLGMVYERGAPHYRGHFAYRTEVAALNVDKISPGLELDTLVAEQVFGWKNVHKQGHSLRQETR